MQRAATWFMLTLILIFASVAFGVALVNASQASMSAVITVSMILLIVMGLMVTGAMWLAFWMNGPDYSKTRVMHDHKLMRHQLNALRSELSQRDRTILDLEEQIKRLQAQRETQVAPQVASHREAIQTGTYRQLHPPTDLSSETGQHPIVQ